MERGLFELRGRHALVTGAEAPLSRALACALAECGARVSALCVDDSVLPGSEAAARETLDACTARSAAAAPGGLRCLPTWDLDVVRECVAALEAEVAPVDILVNASHRATVKPFLEVSSAEWARELDDNVTACFATTRAVGPSMLERGFGRVINVVSLLSQRGMPNVALVGAAQGALLGFTRALGLEWVRSGVTVNALCIGFVTDVPGPQEDAATREAIGKFTPVRRIGELQDLEGAVVFLASDEAGFIVSEALLVDGGLSTHA